MKICRALLPAALATLLSSPVGAQTLVTPPAMRASGFAASVAIADGAVVVGRTGSEIRMATYPRPGAVFRYGLAAEGEWSVTAALAPSSGTVGDQFGRSLAFEREMVVIGAPGTRDAAGVAYVYRRTGTDWLEVARLDPREIGNAGAGSSVLFLGSQIAVGAPGGLRDLTALGQPAPPQPGAVHVFEPSGDDWTPAQRLTAPDGDGRDRFGASMAVVEGDLFVGAPGADAGRGAVYRFRRSGTSWELVGAMGIPDAPASGFGTALAVHDGQLLVGAPGFGGTGGVAVYGPSDEMPSRILSPPDDPGRAAFGTALASDGRTVAVGAPVADGTVGAVYLMSGPDLEDVQTVPGGFGPGAMFGTSVAVADDVAAVGAAQADLRLGAAGILTRSADGTWAVGPSLHDPGRNAVAAITGGEVECEDGVAGDFPCGDVDLVAFIPLDDLGAGPASIANDIWGWTDPATGREYVLMGKSNGTSFVDITDPTSPIVLGHLPLHEGAQENLWRDVKTYRNHAFIVADGAGAHGIQIFDLTRLRDVTNPPLTFEETGHYDGVFSSHNIVINEESGFAYAVGNSGGGPCGGGLHMIDIRDPRSPQFAGCYNDPDLGGFGGAGYTHDAQCVTYSGPDEDYAGREICFHSSIAALGISDVTDKENPVPVANADYPGVVAAHQGWLSEDQRYFFMGDELDEESGTVSNTRTLVWDVAELDDPVLVTQYFADTRAIDHNMYVRGDYLYQSNLMSGLRILDISDPENPVEVAFFDTVPDDDDATAFGGSWSNYPYFPSGVIAVSSWNEGLFLLKKRERALVP